jgi:lysophospholipase L1-like esterase
VTDAARLRYVALGDSYTIGTAVEPADAWPAQLVERLAADPPPVPLELVANHAVNGATAGDIVRSQLPLLRREPALGFVSLLVGVNDVLGGDPVPAYRSNVATILDELLGRLAPDRILGVETPDYTVTPMGAAFGDRGIRRAMIVAFNAAFAELCRERGIPYVGGILAISAEASGDPGLVAADGLHPSAGQYRRWVSERIEPAVRGLLTTP